MREEILTGLRAEVVELLDLESPDEIHEKSRLTEDLGLDSLAMVDLVTMVEERFSIKLATNTDLTTIETVGDVIDVLEDQRSGKAGLG